MKLKIAVPEPCNQNWEQMTPNALGRFCTQCSKTVIDFTEWETKDIAMHLWQNASEKPCGRFLSTQLNTTIEINEIIPKIIEWEKPIWRKVAALIVVCFALGQTACVEGADNVQKKDGTAIAISSDTLAPFDTFSKIGEAPIVLDSSAKKNFDLLGGESIVPPPKVLEPTTIEPVESHIMGGIPVMEAIVDTIQ